MKVGSRQWAVGSRQWAVSSAILMLTLGCQQQKKDVQPAFYHWQTEFNLTNVEENYLDSLSIKKLYLKFFDVDWNESQAIPVPLAPVEFLNFQISKFPNFQISPCVFITNRTFQNIADDKIEWLSERVRAKLQELKPKNLTFSEIQFDCDWTASTRDHYFTFLKVFKKTIENQGVKISATIRLHQLRDFETTGVPPVDHGMLMFYNTGDVEDWEEENSILNLEVAEQYLILNTQYPIPLDLALPIFRWGVLFRDDKMIRLINNLETNDLQDTSRFRKIGDNRFEIVKSTYLDAYYLYKNDRIRTEAIDTNLLTKAADLLKNRLKNRNLTLAFYHLDTSTIKHLPHEFLEKITHTFQ